MNSFRLWALAGALAASFIVTTSFAAAQDDVSQIKQQLDELDQKIRVLQRLQELDKEAATARAKAAAISTFSISGPILDMSAADVNPAPRGCTKCERTLYCPHGAQQRHDSPLCEGGQRLSFQGDE